MSDDALLHDFQSITEPLRWEKLFSVQQPAELEIGCGDGGFLLEWASRHPEKNFLGVERLLGRLRKLSKKGSRAGLTNLRLLRIEARYLIQYLLPKNSFEAIHIYFPDPWPKDKHRRHRLIDADFPALAARILAPHGVLHLRTDDPSYFEQMQKSFAPAADFAPEESPAALAALTTEFERQWNAEGKKTHRASFRLSG
jgi:tRNA (guanine-N7-)-methyltransferase